jgi:hypothetical protein
VGVADSVSCNEMRQTVYEDIFSFADKTWLEIKDFFIKGPTFVPILNLYNKV